MKMKAEMNLGKKEIKRGKPVQNFDSTISLASQVPCAVSAEVQSMQARTDFGSARNLQKIRVSQFADAGEQSKELRKHSKQLNYCSGRIGKMNGQQNTPQASFDSEAKDVNQLEQLMQPQTSIRKRVKKNSTALPKNELNLFSASTNNPQHGKSKLGSAKSREKTAKRTDKALL